MSKVLKVKLNNTDYDLPGGGGSMYTATISTSWTGSSAPFTQDLTVTGILATDVPIVDLVPSATYSTAQSQIRDYAKIYKMEVTAANTIKVYATAQTSVALPISLRCIR